MRDISNRQDLEVLVRAFYERAFVDPLLRPVFVDVVQVDLERHLPVVVDFWERVLFDSGGYAGRPMDVHRRVHQRIALTPEHFSRWVGLWLGALAERFAGPVAARAGAHGARMAAGFVRALAGPPLGVQPPPGVEGLRVVAPNA